MDGPLDFWCEGGVGGGGIGVLGNIPEKIEHRLNGKKDIVQLEKRPPHPPTCIKNLMVCP